MYYVKLQEVIENLEKLRSERESLKLTLISQVKEDNLIIASKTIEKLKTIDDLIKQMENLDVMMPKDEKKKEKRKLFH